MVSQKPPIYCDNGEQLALASLDGASLCAECLIEAILASADPDVTSRVKPLRFANGEQATDWPIPRRKRSG